MSPPLLYCLTCAENSRVRKVVQTKAGDRWSISTCLNKGCKERVRTCRLDLGAKLVDRVNGTTAEALRRGTMSPEKYREWSDEKTARDGWDD